MKINLFSQKLRESMSTNKLLTVGLVAAVLLGLLQQLKINQMRERIVLQPPGLTERAEIGSNSANEAYYKSWAIFVATIVGSVTPSESESTLKILEPYFTREAWLPVRSHVNSIRLDPNYQQFAAVNQFMPRLAIYEPSTKKTFVQGTQKTSVYRESKSVPLSQVEVTYEMTVVIQSGIPKVSSITSYRGPAHTLEWAQRFPSAAAVFKTEQAKQADQLTPQLSPSLPIEPGAMGNDAPPSDSAPAPVAPTEQPAPVAPSEQPAVAPSEQPTAPRLMAPQPPPVDPFQPPNTRPTGPTGQQQQQPPANLSSSDRL